jgi:hypothetical protein
MGASFQAYAWSSGFCDKFNHVLLLDYVGEVINKW